MACALPDKLRSLNRTFPEGSHIPTLRPNRFAAVQRRPIQSMKILTRKFSPPPEVLKKYAELTGAVRTVQGVTGVLGTLFGGKNNDFGQLAAAFSAAAANIAGIAGWIRLETLNLDFPLLTSKQDGMAGLAIPEMVVEAYPDFHLSNCTSPPFH